MGLPVTLYRWDDAGAPQITTGTTKLSQVLEVIKKCLVEGYGTKADLGWTIAMEDAINFKIAFRNSTIDGSGGYFQFNSSNNTANGDMRFRGGMDMTDFDTFTNPTPAYGLTIHTSNTKWYLIGTSRSFYLQLLPDSYDNSVLTTQYIYAPMFFVGDVDTLLPNDVGSFIVTRGNNALGDLTTYNGSVTLSYIPNQTCITMYNADGIGTAVYGLAALGSYAVNSVALASDSDWVNENKSAFLDPVIIRAYVSKFDSELTPFIRGYMPGLYQASLAGYKSTPHLVIRNILGIDHLLLVSYTAGLNWISLGDWYD
ncbi:hypothetical protein [Shewanella sp. TB4-MNA-CIBAN-0142]|uniref:hypothetical protein n=1 Tax=Shewanella sp. TB4-MNA-CIBAN-0142 TaxID=3140464 RepID=UPI00333306C6